MKKANRILVALLSLTMGLGIVGCGDDNSGKTTIKVVAYEGGYGYNWVFKKNWAANLSLLPGVGFKKAKINDQNDSKNDWIKDIDFNLITRAGITYNNSKYFIGAALVMHTYDYRKTYLSVTNSFGTLRIYAGFNFWKKREYKNNLN